MIYEQDKLEKLASEIKKYLLECKLGDAYIESFRDLVPAGGKGKRNCRSQYWNCRPESKK